MSKQGTYPGQPKGLPDTIKLKINNIPVIIEYKESRVVTPKAAGVTCGHMVTKYLIAEGFLESHEGGNNGETDETEDDLVY
jgi:hypothetical protein